MTQPRRLELSPALLLGRFFDGMVVRCASPGPLLDLWVLGGRADDSRNRVLRFAGGEPSRLELGDLGAAFRHVQPVTRDEHLVCTDAGELALVDGHGRVLRRRRLPNAVRDIQATPGGLLTTLSPEGLIEEHAASGPLLSRLGGSWAVLNATPTGRWAVSSSGEVIVRWEGMDIDHEWTRQGAVPVAFAVVDKLAALVTRDDECDALHLVALGYRRAQPAWTLRLHHAGLGPLRADGWRGRGDEICGWKGTDVFRFRVGDLVAL